MSSTATSPDQSRYQRRDGARYVLLFVDAWFRFSSAYLLRERYEFFDRFVEYKAWVETYHNREVKRFISEIGGEYIDNRFNVDQDARVTVLKAIEHNTRA